MTELRDRILTAGIFVRWIRRVRPMPHSGSKMCRDLKISAVTVPEKKTFADNLSEAVATEAEGKNWSISPYSAQMALAMLTAGAKGQTQKSSECSSDRRYR